MASVYRAVDERNGRPVAVKVLLPDADEVMRARFRQEARTHSNLRHPNIVPILDVGQENGLTYIVMELIEGPSLAELMEDVARLPPNDAARVLEPIARALDYAHHRGVVHRDVKPSNVLLRMVDGKGEHTMRIGALAYAFAPLLSDFGIARALDAPELTNVGRTVGTPTYMSPEQCADSHEIDGRSDIYSLGAVFYRCVVGRPPYSGTTTQILHAHVYDPLTIPDDMVDALPPLAVRLLQRSLAKDPGQRYADGSAMGRDLAVLAGSPYLIVPSGEATATMDAVPAVRPATGAAVIVPAPDAGLLQPRPYDAPPPYAARPMTPVSVAAVRPRRRWLGALLGTLLAAIVLAAGIGLALNMLPFDLLPGSANATSTPAVVAGGQGERATATAAPATAAAASAVGADGGTPSASAPAPSATVEPGVTTAAPPATSPATGAITSSATPGESDLQPTTAPTPAGSIDSYWREAEDAYGERDWQVALEYITLVRRIDPTFSQGVIDQMLTTIHTQLAAEAIAINDLEVALGSINAAIAAQPDSPQLIAIQRALESLVAPNTLDKVMARWNLAAELVAYGQDLLTAARPCDATRQFQAASALLPDSDVSRLAAESQAQCNRLLTEEQMRKDIVDLGGRLLYSTQENGRYRIYRAPAAENGASSLLVDEARQPGQQAPGDLLAFHTTRPGEAGIALFDVAVGLPPSGRSGRLSNAPEDGLDAPASWSPGNDQAIYASTAFGDRRSRILLTITGNPDVRQDRGFGRDPAWHPFADRIVYNGVDDGGANPGLWLMNSDGSNRVRITDNGNDIRPVWSPDGRYIVFMSTRNGSWDLYRYDTQDGALRRITDDPAQDGIPAVSPDGKWVAFASDRDGFWRIWVTSIDGGLALPFVPINGALVSWLEHAIQWTG